MLDTTQFLLRHQANLDGGQPGFSVKKFDEDVQWKLSMAIHSTAEAMVPSLEVIVGSYGLLEHRPV